MNEEIILDKLRKMLFTTQQANECGLSNNDFKEDIETLSGAIVLIQKQDKIIDKFSKALVNCVGTCPIDYNDDFENDCENCQDTLEKCWIEFFKKEVEKNVKNV